MRHTLAGEYLGRDKKECRNGLLDDLSNFSMLYKFLYVCSRKECRNGLLDNHSTFCPPSTSFYNVPGIHGMWGNNASDVSLIWVSDSLFLRTLGEIVAILCLYELHVRILLESECPCPNFCMSRSHGRFVVRANINKMFAMYFSL